MGLRAVLIAATDQVLELTQRLKRGGPALERGMLRGLTDLDIERVLLSRENHDLTTAFTTVSDAFMKLGLKLTELMEGVKTISLSEAKPPSEGEFANHLRGVSEAAARVLTQAARDIEDLTTGLKGSTNGAAQ